MERGKKKNKRKKPMEMTAYEMHTLQMRMLVKCQLRFIRTFYVYTRYTTNSFALQFILLSGVLSFVCCQLFSFRADKRSYCMLFIVFIFLREKEREKEKGREKIIIKYHILRFTSTPSLCHESGWGMRQKHCCKGLNFT